MKIVDYKSVENDIVKQLRQHTLVPILGSGFTCNCASKNGKVPSGNDYKNFMISKVTEAGILSTEELEELPYNSFSNIAEIYNSLIDQKARISYLRNNFSCVSLESYKKEFLSIDWPYIYTLNLDDAIERNSEFDKVILPEKEVFDEVFDEQKCVIKIHGDINYITTYKDDACILSQRQYVNSISKNKTILHRLRHDNTFLNLLYIGCSLNDEIDLMSTIDISLNHDNKTSKYYFGVKQPSYTEKVKLENFGITHYVIFNSFEEIYVQLINAFKESKKVINSELNNYEITNVSKLFPVYSKNKPYLLFGKSIKDNNTLLLPYFFICRDISEKILKQMDLNAVQIIFGKSYSGKTYILADIASKIRNSTVFLFESKNSINQSAFEELICKKNCTLLFDSKSLDPEQLERIIDERITIKNNNTHIIISSDKTNQDLYRLLTLKQIKGELNPNDIPQTKIPNIFSSVEEEEINSLLSTVNLGLFKTNNSIVDSIIRIGELLKEKNRFGNYRVVTNSVESIASLIMLAIEKKVNSKRAVQFCLVNEFESQVKMASPLINKELVWSFEKSPGDTSPEKYVIDAEYWLNLKLKEYANNEYNEDIIADAFKYIVTILLMINKKPSIFYSDNSSYKDYILFDNINRIFSTSINSSNRLIRKIYEKLNPLLSTDPNFKHQYSKCLIQSAKTASSLLEKEEFLFDALRNITEALEIFNARFEENSNFKLTISIDHAKYTKAVILCHLCKLKDYRSDQLNDECIQTLFEAMISKNNSFDYVKKDQINYNDAIGKTISYFLTNKSDLSKQNKDYITRLANIMLKN